MLFPAAKRLDSDSLTSVLRLIQRGPVHVAAIRAIATSTVTTHIQLYDSAASTTIVSGTTVPDWTVRCAASSPSDGDGLPTGGLLFENGLVALSSTLQVGETAQTVANAHLKICIL